jgi:septum formation inhibitor MinC
MDIKKTIALLIVIITFTTIAFAQKESQEKLSMEERVEKQVERMEKSLNLSQEQRQKLYDIQLNTMKENAILNEKRKAQRLAREKIRNQKMKEIFSEEQFEKYLDLKGGAKMKRKIHKKSRKYNPQNDLDFE